MKWTSSGDCRGKADLALKTIVLVQVGLSYVGQISREWNDQPFYNGRSSAHTYRASPLALHQPTRQHRQTNPALQRLSVLA